MTDIGTIPGLRGRPQGNQDIAPVTDAGVGTTSDAAIITNTTGSVSGKLRGLVKWAFERMPAALGQTTMAASLPVAIASNQSTLNTQVRARTLDSVSGALATDAIMSNLTALTPKFAAIGVSATGTIVGAVTAKKLRVLAWTLSSSGTVNVKWQSHVTPTDISGLFYLVANNIVSVPFSPVGYFETVAGEALDLNLSANIAVGGVLTYVEV